MKKFLIIILLGILAPTLSARAFSLSPLKYIFSVDAGETVSADLILNNYESSGVDLEPVVVGMKADENGRPIFDNSAEVVAWAKPDWNFYTLKEGVEKKVKFFITVPIGTYPGDYYLGVGARRAADNKNAVSIGAQVLTVVNLKVAGQAREDLSVNKFDNVSSFYNKDKKLVWEIKNNGNVEMPISAVLKIYDWRGRLVNENATNVGNKILPLASRVGEADFSPEAGKFFWPGRYQANLTVDYGLTKQQITTVKYFWYLPGWIWFVKGAVIVLIIIGIFIVRKNKHAIK